MWILCKEMNVIFLTLKYIKLERLILYSVMWKLWMTTDVKFQVPKNSILSQNIKDSPTLNRSCVGRDRWLWLISASLSEFLNKFVSINMKTASWMQINFQTKLHVQEVTFEPEHNKTNNITCAPSKDSDQSGISPVWSESSLSTWRKFRSLITY